MSNSYRLDSSAHEAVYKEEIEPAYFLTATPVESPTLAIVGGQPGAGKTKVLEVIKRDFSDNNVVVVNTDDLREYHPAFQEIAAIDDRQCANHTHEDASGWNQKLLSRSIETHRNVILEGVFKDSSKLGEIVRLAKNQGYKVTFSVVAANERYSIWGIHKRYEKEKIAKEYGRFVPLEYHNECYKRLPDTVDMVERERTVDRIEVYTRDAGSVYSNELDCNKWKSPEGAKSALISERERVLTEPEREAYKLSWESVFEYMKKRGASEEEENTARAIAARLVKEAYTD